MHAVHCGDVSAGPVQPDAAAAGVFTAAAESAAQRWKSKTAYKAKVSVVTNLSKASVCVYSISVSGHVHSPCQSSTEGIPVIAVAARVAVALT